MFSSIMIFSQFCFTIVIGLYFLSMLKGQYSSKNSIHKESRKELERLKKLNNIKLTVPLTEKTRPSSVRDIIGQEDGIKALRAALCGENPQHILIYGPPGVGKTAAARVVLDEARKSERSPFRRDAKLIEVDATTMQFDERSIADPLIGSVHDPIYQGAGAYGPAGVPQPKEGAVTRAHGGVLFIDEIGELNSIQLNKLLKVLEDRRVYFDSAYYSSSNREIPGHIHEIFRNGLPADFRLIGATTRLPEEIPAAVRSRCVEIFFKPLSRESVKKIAADAAAKTGFGFADGVFDMVADYADNGRDAVNIIQTAESEAKLEGKTKAELSDIEWVIETGKYTPRYEKHILPCSRVGQVCGLAVFGSGQGCILDIEAAAQPCGDGCGELVVTGAIEEEEFTNRSQKLRRKSSIDASVRNVMTVLRLKYGIACGNYKIHINFPCSVPVDGPSAGIAIFAAVYSAIFDIKIDSTVAMTGEISIGGAVCGVGEVPLKVRAALNAGAKRIIIPSSNWQETFAAYPAEIIPVSTVDEVIDAVLCRKNIKNGGTAIPISENIGIISAEGVDISSKK